MTITKSDFIALLIGFIAGIRKHNGGKVLHFNGTDFVEDDLVATFQSVIDTADEVRGLDTQKAAALVRAVAAMEKARPLAKGFKAMILAASGNDVEVLADYSLEPPKVTVLTPEAKVIAAKKAAATRQALGTKGSAQKKRAKKALASQPPAGVTPPKA